MPPSLDNAQEGEGDGQKKTQVPLAIPSIPLPKLHPGTKVTGKEACQGTKCHHLHPILVSVTHLFGSPSLCTLTGTSILLSCSPPGNSHHSGTPCSHTAILLQKNIKKKEGQGCQPRCRTSTWHPLHVVIPGLGRAQTGATHTPFVRR